MHQVNDLVIHCIDFRFRPIVADWIREELSGQADLVAMAGVSKAFLDEDTRPSILKQVKLAQDLHGMTTVHLMDHIDCGAYGGSAQHENNEQERALHTEKLCAATELIKEQFPDLIVKCYIVDRDAVAVLHT